MSKDNDEGDDLLEETVQALQTHFKVTEATRKKLERGASFQFIHHVLKHLHEKYPWFGKGLLSEKQWESPQLGFGDNEEDKKRQWRQRKKWIATILMYLKFAAGHEECMANPSRVIRGQNVEDTLRFLQLACTIAGYEDLDWETARSRTLETLQQLGKYDGPSATTKYRESSTRDERMGSLDLRGCSKQEAARPSVHLSSTMRSVSASSASGNTSIQRPQSARARLAKDTVHFNYSKDSTMELLGLTPPDAPESRKSRSKRDQINVSNPERASRYGLLNGLSERSDSSLPRHPTGFAQDSSKRSLSRPKSISRPSTASSLPRISEGLLDSTAGNLGLQNRRANFIQDDALLRVLSGGPEKEPANDPENLLNCAESGDEEQLRQLLGVQSTTYQDQYYNLVRIYPVTRIRETLRRYNTEGYSALHYAARRGHARVVDILLRCGFDPSTQNEDGEVPLHLASWKGTEEVIDKLADYMESVDLLNKYQQTPLFLALETGNFSAAALLVRRGADLYSEDRFGDSPQELCEDNPKYFQQLEAVSRKRNAFIEKQPGRIWGYVFSFLTKRERRNIGRICSKWRRSLEYVDYYRDQRNLWGSNSFGGASRGRGKMVPGRKSGLYLGR
eukprot:gb/GECG01015963.1/.p1 GENE.gb/GECG01015963.1/~~gb/GECG01015963.1/.p1  ORF type:complete len:620 (+),score=67.92 gb/GECG01015963.1/:1-1860(+)